MNRNYLKPAEISRVAIETGVSKVKTKRINQFILAILAGVFIAFAAGGSNMAAFNLLARPETFGLGRTLAGTIFGTGLMLVVVAGGELFTGNSLIMAGVLEKQIKVRELLNNWLFVFLGNFVGSLFIAYMMVHSGLFNSGDYGLGATTIIIAVNKVSLDFIPAFYLGIMCNWLVCLAIWMSYASIDLTGKIFAIFFPIWLFITSGFEHSVANMYYIPAGIMAKSNSNWAIASNLTTQQLDNLNWSTFITNNMIPVTLGNIVGGAIFAAAGYWFVYVRNNPDRIKSEK
ncbi:formate/nitrite transporter family protein [Alkalibaculum sp. M08DMB]|uniref:Formate/nitrite transporter family protein n=1 Tax=Alkalibaculum sporogenes TaxID=2655001 RepID=A0A6A7KCH7_9FIRM|nr:formate/nitrite transporter family protein [Alkalibaculum sporogenes]MPW27240.1 formate/nitrite transporter family protein [Alkalibaculum sporogenes]